jgi:maltose/maltodextrin transport system permease protein
LLNSLFVSTVAAFLVVLLSTSAAYAFARLRFRFQSSILTSLLILQMFPSVVAIIALYGLLDGIGSYVPTLGLNSRPGLVIAYLGGIATHIWMIKGYFDTVPDSIEEAARIDGATPFQAFLQVLLPMSVPALVVTFILAFIGTIGEYPLASVVLQSTQLWTLAVGANSFLYEQHYQWGAFAATAVLAGVPITLMFLLCQRFLVSGLTAGASKE